MDEANEKEARAVDTINQLKLEIANLSKLVEQGAGLSLGQDSRYGTVCVSTMLCNKHHAECYMSTMLGITLCNKHHAECYMSTMLGITLCNKHHAECYMSTMLGITLCNKHHAECYMSTMLCAS